MMEQRRVLSGVILIIIGIVFLVAQRYRIGGEAVVAAIGIAFLAAFAYTRNYGYLVPGGIMTGLGLGILYQAYRGGDTGWAVVLGLGLGFVGIYVVDVLTRGQRPGRWWPLVPGGILTAIGLLQATGQPGLIGTIARWWPLMLIAIGLWLLFRRRDEPPQPPAAG